MNEAQRFTRADCSFLIRFRSAKPTLLRQELADPNLLHRVFFVFDWTLRGAGFTVLLPSVNPQVPNEAAEVFSRRDPRVASANRGDHAPDQRRLQFI
jgi:hypothetical protein